MKSMTCKELGGACNVKFRANTFEEIITLSKEHAMEMVNKGDEAHILAMEEMRQLMRSPEEMQDWLEMKKKDFDALPQDE
jgi:hypothetical protein